MSNRRHVRSLILTLSILLCAAVLLVSMAPLNRVALGTRPRAGSSQALVERAALIHLAVHIAGYGMLAWLAWCAAGIAAARLTGKTMALLLIFFLGFITEYLQHRIYKHPIEINDVAANLLSSAAVFGLMALRARWRRSRGRQAGEWPVGVKIANRCGDEKTLFNEEQHESDL